MARLSERTSDVRAGFTLLEVTVAFVVLAVGVLGVTGGQIAAFKHSATSRNHTMAMDLAEEQMEILQEMSAADVKALTVEVGYPADPNNPLQPDPGNPTEFTRRRIVAVDTPEAGVILMTVEVDFVNALGAVKTVRLRTLKADT